MLNPVNHGSTAEDIAVYRVEPYVVAADIYSVAPHVGRGGWTWYTGASGWLYRAGLEAILGINKEGNTLHVKPCMPPEWKEYEVSVKFGATVYQIVVQRDTITASKHPATTKISDDEFIISLNDDGGIQRVELQFNTTNVKRPVS